MTPIDRARLERLLCESRSRDSVESRRPSWMLVDDLAAALRELIAWADEARELLDDALGNRRPRAGLYVDDLLARWPAKEPDA